MHLLSKSFHMMAIMMRRNVEEKYYLVSKLVITMKVVIMTTLMMMRMMGFGKYQQNGQPRSARSGRDWNTEKHKTFHKRNLQHESESEKTSLQQMKVKVKRHLYSK